jgi:hypothetical protein
MIAQRTVETQILARPHIPARTASRMPALVAAAAAVVVVAVVAWLGWHARGEDHAATHVDAGPTVTSTPHAADAGTKLASTSSTAVDAGSPPLVVTAPPDAGTAHHATHTRVAAKVKPSAVVDAGVVDVKPPPKALTLAEARRILSSCKNDCRSIALQLAAPLDEARFKDESATFAIRHCVDVCQKAD